MKPTVAERLFFWCILAPIIFIGEWLEERHLKRLACQRGNRYEGPL